MAESVVKIRIDSQEYDAKLKKAGDALNRYFDTVRKGGGTLAILDEGVLDAVKAMGQMETASNSAKGKVGELTKAFTEMHVQYQQLTDDEKSSPIGQEMSKSLEQLKQRLAESKTQLNNATSAISNLDNSSSQASGVLDTLASKFVVNIDALKLFNAGLSALKMALDVAKDAFFSSETNVDEWGRTVASANTVYETFLHSLNSGDFSGFLSRINQVITKAKEAYNAFDELQTVMTIINPERAKLQARQTQLKAIIRREGANSTVGQVAQQELLALEPLLSKAYTKESQLNWNAFKKEVKRMLSTEKGLLEQVDINDLMKTFSSESRFRQLQARASGGVTYESTGMGMYRSTKTVDTRNTEQKILDLFTDEWRTQWSPLLTASFNAVGSAAGVMLGDARYIKQTGGGSAGRGGGGGTRGDRTTTVTEVLPVGSVADLTKQMQELQKAQQLVTDTAGWKSYQDQIDAVKKSIDALKGITTVKDRYKQIVARDFLLGGYFSSDLNRQSVSQMALGGLDLANIPLERRKEWLGLTQTPSMQSLQFETPSTTEQLDKISNSIDTFTGGISKIFSGLSAMGIELPKELVAVINAIQGVSSIITGVGTLIELFSTTSHTANTAAVAGNTIALTANTAALASVSAALAANTATNFLPFANGGVVHAAGGIIVPGNHRSGDMVPAMLNSGELVLNRAQQGNLASQLQGNMSNLNLTATISGEQIRLALNNASRRRGRGEYVTSKTIR